MQINKALALFLVASGTVLALVEADCPSTFQDIVEDQPTFCEELCGLIFNCAFVDFVQFDSFLSCTTSCEGLSEEDYGGILCLTNTLCDGSCSQAAANSCLGFGDGDPTPPSDPTIEPIRVQINIGSLGCDEEDCDSAVWEDEYGLLPYATYVVNLGYKTSSCFLDLYPMDPQRQFPYHVRLNPAFVASQAEPEDPLDPDGYYLIGEASCSEGSESPGATSFGRFNILEDIDRSIAGLVEAAAGGPVKPVMKATCPPKKCSAASDSACKGKKKGYECTMSGLTKERQKGQCMVSATKGNGNFDCFCGRPEGICSHLAIARSLVDLGVVDSTWDCIVMTIPNGTLIF